MAIKWKMGDLFKGLIQENGPSTQPEARVPEDASPAPTPA